MKSVDANERLIAELYHRFPWYGSISIVDAIEGTLHYRQGLNAEDRKFFDEQIQVGVHPKAATQNVEIASGRLQPQSKEPAIVK